MKPMKKKRESGQGTVELLITFFAFFTVLFMYAQVALGFGVANFFQYATFAAARAHLAGAISRKDQEEAGRQVLTFLVKRNGADRFSSIAKGSGEGDPEGSFIGGSSRAKLRAPESRRNAWEQGVKYSFNMRLYLMPLIRGIGPNANKPVELTSEAWLGREPSEEECIKLLEDRQKESGIKGAKAYLYDNGC
jgi:hypothetical protein